MDDRKELILCVKEGHLPPLDNTTVGLISTIYHKKCPRCRTINNSINEKYCPSCGLSLRIRTRSVYYGN